jgi:hypothetical protein
MARTNILAQYLIGAYPALPLASGEADLMFTATDDPTSLYSIIVSNKTTLLAYNTDSVAHTVTIGSVADVQNRTGDIVYSVAAGKVAAFGPFQTPGWSNAGNLNIDIDNAMLRLAVITLP